MTEPYYVQKAAERMEDAIKAFISAAKTGDWNTGYRRGYEDGLAAAQPSVPDIPTMLRKVAGWVDSQQLPVDGPHATESQVRRRLVVLLRDLAEQPQFGLTAVCNVLDDQ